MLDPSGMYPRSFHPVEQSRTRDFKSRARFYTRTQRPPRYLWIDFGHSRIFKPEDDPPLQMPAHGGDKTAPEFQGEKYSIPCNPFPTDIYYLGNLINGWFINVGFNALCDIVV